MTWRVEIYLTASPSLFYWGLIRKDESEQLPIIRRVSLPPLRSSKLFLHWEQFAFSTNVLHVGASHDSLKVSHGRGGNWCTTLLDCVVFHTLMFSIPGVRGRYTDNFLFVTPSVCGFLVLRELCSLPSLGLSLTRCGNVLVSWVLYDLTPIGALGLVKLCRYWFKMDRKWCLFFSSLGHNLPGWRSIHFFVSVITKPLLTSAYLLTDGPLDIKSQIYYQKSNYYTTITISSSSHKWTSDW